jgi:peptidoglycan hydrolase-like protein with peptidoglycan-binding domain
MALQSQLFRGDSKLEAAAFFDAAHILPGARGTHVGKIQQALIQVDGAVIARDSVYGPATSAAVANFKRNQAPPILNFAGTIDNIVGKKTIAALDAGMLAQEKGGGLQLGFALGEDLFENVGSGSSLGLPQDIFVLLEGTGNRNEEGAALFKEEELFRKKPEFNTTAYLAGHQPVAPIIFFGGRGDKDPSAKVAARVVAQRAGTPSGVTIIAGNSVGALSALKTAALVSALDVQIDYLCICDGAFFDRDGEIVTVNPLQIKLPAGITALKAKKDNFFQTFGHELLRGQGKNVGPRGFAPGVEFHGPLNSFNNDDLEKTGANTQAKIAEIKQNMAKLTFIDTPAKRIAAGNQLHVAAVDDGEQKRDLVIKMLLIKP